MWRLFENAREEIIRQWFPQKVKQAATVGLHSLSVAQLVARKEVPFPPTTHAETFAALWWWPTELDFQRAAKSCANSVNSVCVCVCVGGGGSKPCKCKCPGQSVGYISTLYDIDRGGGQPPPPQYATEHGGSPPRIFIGNILVKYSYWTFINFSSNVLKYTYTSTIFNMARYHRFLRNHSTRGWK